jgi:hypothetical protein
MKTERFSLPAIELPLPYHPWWRPQLFFLEKFRMVGAKKKDYIPPRRKERKEKKREERRRGQGLSVA